MPRRSAIVQIASAVSGSMPKPSCATKRTARIMRSGSSSNDWRGSTGVRNTRFDRSFAPPKGSTNSRSGTRNAIAFTVKSRRDRSPSSESP